MIGYAAKEVFSRRELQLLDRAQTLVAMAPYEINDELVRCHELARAIGEVLELKHEDGRYGFVEHTWLWTSEKDPEGSPWVLPNVLDVYTPGCDPQVQLVHMALGLPPRYYLSNVFDVEIKDDIVIALIGWFQASELWPLDPVEPP